MILKRTDRKLLQDALNSNGGGVRDTRYADATIERLIKQGLLQEKPNQGYSTPFVLLTITKAGKKALEEAVLDNRG